MPSRLRPARLGWAVLCVGVFGIGAFGAENPSAGAKVRTAAAGPALIELGSGGGFVVGGRPTFLVALSNPPPLGGRTPQGLRGLAEVVRSGVNLLRVGPTWTGWTQRELEGVLAWDRAAVRLRVHTWVRLNAFAATQPRWRGDAHLSAVIHALTKSPSAAGIGLWQGADEPRSRGIAPRSLAFVYCRLTGRGGPRACAGEPPLDPRHLLLTILAPSGTPAQLAPYGGVSDELGVDVYPVALANPDAPNLHTVGAWTAAVAAISRRRGVWTTLQICSIHQFDRRTGLYLLPTAYEERFMVYDAIINGARGISFFGGGNPHCWNQIDSRYRWNWAFWNTVLDQLIEEVGSHSALAPALADVASNRVLGTTDPGTEAISRLAVTPRGVELWVIAARYGAGTRRVAISGIPSAVKSAAVYGERHALRVADGRLRDTFRQWQVHVYRMQLSAAAVGDLHSAYDATARHPVELGFNAGRSSALRARRA